MFTSLAQAKKYCKDNKVKMIDFKMVDLFGRWHHLTIPTGRLTEETLSNGIGFDGSNYGFAPIEKSDMIFIPDLSSAYMEPFTQTPTLSMIGDVYVTGNPPKRFEQDPRAVAHKAEEYMKQTGIADLMKTGPEFEFYIFDRVSYEVTPNSSGFKIDSREADWNSNQESNLGYTVPLHGGYHAIQPHDTLHDLRSEMCLLLEERGVAIKYHHHEVGGSGQLEIEVESGPMLEMADKTMLVKHIVRNAASVNGKSATFMPKPLFGEAGNGMHIHMHLFKNGEPIFYDKEGYSGLSKNALYFIGGLLSHASSLCALTNPSSNSYKRLVPGYEAPVNICFATGNRSAVIRIPDYAKAPMVKRFELRNADATCNPYYAYAAVLMAGLDGIKNKINPTESGFGPYDVNLYNLTKEEQKKIKSLPKSFEEALDALEEDYQYLIEGEVFSNRLLEIWIQKKREEINKISQITHPAEFGLYYDL
jgi:glutamine synthetase